MDLQSSGTMMAELSKRAVPPMSTGAEWVRGPTSENTANKKGKVTHKEKG